MRRPLALLTLLPALVVSPASAQPALPAGNSVPCKVATDAQYGYDRARPIQVGGSPMYGAARQRRYLDFLRGPEGQPVTWQRKGSAPGPDGNTVLDSYTVCYEGLDTPVTLYLDWYHDTEPMPWS